MKRITILACLCILVSQMAFAITMPSPQEGFLRLSADGSSLLKTSYKTAADETVLNFSEMRINPLDSVVSFQVSPDELRLLLQSADGSYYIYKTESNRCDLLSDSGAVCCPVFSPDGKKLAYSRNGDVFIKRLEYNSEIRVTEDGKNGVSNGCFDKDFAKAFDTCSLMKFSPDGMYLVFSKDRQICLYSIQYKWTKTIDTGTDNDAYYFTNAEWFLSGEYFWLSAINKRQNKYYLIKVNASTLVAKTLYQYATDTFISAKAATYLTVISDKGDVLLLSEKNKLRQLVRLNGNGKQTAELSAANADVSEVYGVGNGKVFYAAQNAGEWKNSPMSVSLSGGKATILGSDNANYKISFVNGYDNMLITSCFADGSCKVVTATSTGKTLSAIDKTPAKSARRLIEVDGFQLILSEPADNAKALILLSDAYDCAQQWEETLVKEGYVVARLVTTDSSEDNKALFKRLCLEPAQKYAKVAVLLKENGYAPDNKVFIIGKNLSATVALMAAIQDSTAFDGVVAVAPVSDLSHYNPIFVERYMLTEGATNAYRLNSPIENIAGFNSRMLLIHATDDEKSPIENTYRLTDALINADKQFNMQIYPFRNQTYTDELNGQHIKNLINEFLN